MKIRAIPKTVKELRAQDPNGKISYKTIRALVLSGTLSSVRSGT